MHNFLLNKSHNSNKRMENILSRKYLYPSLVKRIQKKENCILATVVESHGSAPQKPGSSALFDKNDLLEGTIGGGLVEYNMQAKATEVVNSKKSGLFSFELDDEMTNDNSAICGGGMSILLDALPEKHLRVFEALTKSYKERIPGVLVTIAQTDSKEDFIIERIWIDKENFSRNTERFDNELTQRIKNMLEQSFLGMFSEIVHHTSPEFKDKSIFLESIVPLPKLVIAGAGHVGKALSKFGKLLDFEVTVWDDREEYANKKNIPDADIIMSGEFNNTLGKVVPKPDTYIVIVTRGHKNDSEVLKKFIGSNAAYIGMIGSRSKIAQVKEQFIKEGWASTEQWDKIYSPIGLKINSKSVQEIAISIAAQLIQVRNQRNKGNE